MKKLMMILALPALAATTGLAQAATVNVYELSSAQYTNPYAGEWFDVDVFGMVNTLGQGCTGCVANGGDSTLSVYEDGSISIDNANWGFSYFGDSADYFTSFDATGTIGTGVDLYRTNVVCNDITWTACEDNYAGIGVRDGNADWLTGLAQDGVTACEWCATNVFVDGDDIVVERVIRLSEESDNSQTYRLAFTANPGLSHDGPGSAFPDAPVVPVPAAVWFFGSGIGLLGMLRRRRKVAA